MKAIIVGPAHPFRGGIANFSEALCQSFLENGIQSEIVTFTMQYPSFLFPGKTQFAEGNGPDNLKISRHINSVNPLSWIKTADYIFAQKPDILIVMFWMPFMAPALGKISRKVSTSINCKVIGMMHNVIPHEKRFGDMKLINYFVHSCDGFVTLAQSTLDDLKQFSANPNSVFIPHPIYNIFGEKVDKQESRKFLNLKSDEKVILFFGIIRKYKGLDLTLKALAEKSLKNLNIQLIIAGEFYEDKSKYIQLIDELQLKDNVIITENFIPSNEVKHYFCASDLIVQTYHTATQSGVTQIAYNFDRPMLVTNVGGLAEIVPNGKVGYVCEKNPESIANAIADFYNNNRENEFSKNASIEKEKFTWKSMVSGIVDLVKKM